VSLRMADCAPCNLQSGEPDSSRAVIYNVLGQLTCFPWN
jgi:hypothetical protein